MWCFVLFCFWLVREGKQNSVFLSADYLPPKATLKPVLSLGESSHTGKILTCGENFLHLQNNFIPLFSNEY